ncbi:hypothetical protein N234_35535 [Ralstonia pickettii DTP0602]|nr:hypothetical protein N234_35535 [Ralstonia pickettii DTP0602]
MRNHVQRDMRIALTLLTSLFAFGGFLMVYTYAGVVLEPVTRGDERILAGMFLLWGVAATVGNLLSGRLVDRFESRNIINAMQWVAIINFCALPWTDAHASSAVIALAIWGICGWGLIVPQQHRLVQLSPHVAPLLLALNNTALHRTCLLGRAWRCSAPVDRRAVSESHRGRVDCDGFRSRRGRTSLHGAAAYAASRDGQPRDRACLIRRRRLALKRRYNQRLWRALAVRAHAQRALLFDVDNAI